MSRSPVDHPLWQSVQIVPDFPKAGIDFYDITPLLRDNLVATIDAMVDTLPSELIAKTDYMVGIEARGFLFSSLLAARLDKGMVLLRKPNKLPPPTISHAYDLEYGSDTLEMQANISNHNLLLVDDILATGGTLQAAKALCEQNSNQVLGAVVLLDLINLHSRFDWEVYSVLQDVVN